MKIKHLIGLTPGQLIVESSWHRRDAYQRDYDSSVSGMGVDHDFRNRERNAGLEDEVNNIGIMINGRRWKIFRGEGPEGSQEWFDQRQRMKKMCARKTEQTGKQWTMFITGEHPTAESMNEMDKSQKGPPGWNISDDEPGGKESYGKAVKAKDVVKSATKSLNKEMGKTHKKTVKETATAGATSSGNIATTKEEDIEPQHGDLKPWAYWNSPVRVAKKLYQIHRGEPVGKAEVVHLWKTDGPDRMTKFMLKPDLSAILSAYEEMSNQGPLFKESATAGATSAANIGTVDAPHISPGKARGKKSYTGSTKSGSGTKAPPQPKVVQPKKKDGTAVNGLDIKGTSLFGGPKNEAQVIKRR